MIRINDKDLNSYEHFATKCDEHNGVVFIDSTKLDMLIDDLKDARTALKEIAETFPSAVGMNGNAMSDSADYVKLRNNHMIIAQGLLSNS